MPQYSGAQRRPEPSRRGAGSRRGAQGGWASRPPLLGGVVRWQVGGFRYGGFLAAWGLGVRFFWGFGPANDGRSPRMGKNGISRRGSEARRGEETGRLRVPANDANPREWKTRVGSDRRADPKFRRAAPPGGKKDSHRDTKGGKRADGGERKVAEFWKNFEGGVTWQPPVFESRFGFRYGNIYSQMRERGPLRPGLPR